jgi:hypothetical protein
MYYWLSSVSACCILQCLNVLIFKVVTPTCNNTFNWLVTLAYEQLPDDTSESKHVGVIRNKQVLINAVCICWKNIAEIYKNARHMLYQDCSFLVFYQLVLLSPLPKLHFFSDQTGCTSCCSEKFSLN